jgi:hypothetical protein
MNLALLTKWMIGYKDPNVQGVWKTILIAKYRARTSSASFLPFWKGIAKFVDLININLKSVVGNAVNTSFWMTDGMENVQLILVVTLIYFQQPLNLPLQ